MLWTTKRFHTVMGGCMYYEYIVSDDDISTRKHMNHPEKSERMEEGY